MSGVAGDGVTTYVKTEACKYMLPAHLYHGLQGYNWRNVLATFVHVHFGSCPALAAQLVERCAAVDVPSVSAAASAAAEAHAGPRSFPLDGSSFNNCNGVHRQRDYKSATVSPESGPGFSGASRPIFPVSVLTPIRLMLWRQLRSASPCVA